MTASEWWEYLDKHWESIKAICIKWTRFSALELDAAKTEKRPWLAHVLFDAWFNTPDHLCRSLPGWSDLVTLLDEEEAIR